jgi:hypothetical protein
MRRLPALTRLLRLDLIDANRTLKKENAKVKADKAAARTARGQKDKVSFGGGVGRGEEGEEGGGGALGETLTLLTSFSKRQFLGSKGQKTVVAKWIKKYDPASKHYYYENRESGESQWTQPEDYA